MELLTKELEKKFASIGQQDNLKNPLVIAKFFYPAGAATWYATEYLPEDKTFFGWATIFGDGYELGYFSLDELEDFTDKIGLKIERDIHFEPIHAKEISELKQ